MTPKYNSCDVFGIGQGGHSQPCPSCGMVNPEGVNFCQECGTRLGAPAAIICPSCGEEVPEGMKFCGTCGSKIE